MPIHHYKYARLSIASAMTLALIAYNHSQRGWEVQNMTSVTPRLQLMFEKTKTVCFGRFMIDVPQSASTVWGGVIAPLDVAYHPKGKHELEVQRKKFVDDLNSKKAINHNDSSLLLSIKNISQPKGEIIVGYDSFESINGLKINGYFELNEDGIEIGARPLMAQKDETIADIISIAQRLRQRTFDEIPLEPGNCIEYAFLKDKANPNQDDLLEHIRIGFRLKEFPDTHLSIYVAPSNPYNPNDDSLERQWKRMFEGATSEDEKMFSSTKFFRKAPRQIHDWQTGYEVLIRSPDEEGSFSHHDFQVKFVGVPHDPYKPYADIQFQTGVADNAAGATKASLTDEEAVAVWDKITSTIRVRPTSAKPAKTAGADSGARLPLGELAATGRTCPQTGWWTPSESDGMKQGERQHIKAGERMPHVVTLGEPSIWQKLKGERPTYRAGTVWKLVSYDDAPMDTDATSLKPSIAQASPSNPIAKTPPQHKG
jgi:hypothetical protein